MSLESFYCHTATFIPSNHATACDIEPPVGFPEQTTISLNHLSLELFYHVLRNVCLGGEKSFSLEHYDDFVSIVCNAGIAFGMVHSFVLSKDVSNF